MTANNSTQLADGVTGALYTPSNPVPVDFRQYLGVGLSLANPLPVSQAVGGAAVAANNGIPTLDEIQALILNGQGFSVSTGQLSTATNVNIYIGVGILASNIAKNIFIYQWDGMLVQVYGDLQMTVGTVLDATMTAAITPLNDRRDSATVSLATVKSTPAANTTPAATSGTLRRAYGSASNLGVTEMIKQKNGIFIAANSTQAIMAWVKAPAAGNTGMFNFSYVEY